MAHNSNETFNSCSNLGFTYKLVHEYDVGSVEAQTFLTGGEFRFQLSEIEVYVNSIKMKKPVVNETNLNSQILTPKQSLDLIKLCEFGPNDTFTLLYKANRDTFKTKTFHSKCNNTTQTLSILKATNFGYIFGGCTQSTWNERFVSSI